MPGAAEPVILPVAWAVQLSIMTRFAELSIFVSACLREPVQETNVLKN
jgi:hypothetical protein